MAPPAVVYPFIASDFRLMALKTHTPPLNHYSEGNDIVDIPTFIYLMKEGYENRPLTIKEDKQFPSLAHFRDYMMPKPVGEEEWIDYERKDHWKKRALFLALNFRDTPDFYNLVEAVYGDGKDMTEYKNADDLADFYTKYKSFNPLKVDAAELGLMIKGLNVDRMNLIPLEKEIGRAHV